MSNPGGGGLLRRGLPLLQRLVDTVMRRETVGYDKLGNKYIRWHESKNGEQVERRQVDWTGDYSFYEPNKIPSEWRMWLRKQREHPPTEEEMAANEMKAATLQTKVQQLDEKERLRRLRMQALGSQDPAASASPDMSRFLQQLHKDGKGKS
ncbi:hypothetical protein DUNSADRAFT_810 [Dunaliella salina]|uniref:NADH dehydrogenase [ubiquinone] 1 alpha subcomplex subunit 12 n=1 Tax=Dunaliella salina TaxID=3046 RepID=A0ABQ7GXS8_DUNSA|nr:hypothetical protein DUNSADRAFT_810 [Dunaliella salina]|eukprot:KAF5839408.1 hypothetical protein DUNSADRAFT_810 [Dunaliella salina]